MLFLLKLVFVPFCRIHGALGTVHHALDCTQRMVIDIIGGCHIDLHNLSQLNLNNILIMLSFSEETPLPIDTVSFDLARKHFQTLRNKVPEKNIQYGHLKVPIDNPSTKKFRDTPEHQLYTIDKTIFELKPPKSIHNDDMEASSEEEDEPPCLGGYKAFGYHDAVFKAKKFQVKSVTHSDSDLCRPMHRGTGCCGGGHAHGRWARQHYWNHHSSYGHGIRPYDYID